MIPKARRGFTLAEILVGIALLALASAALFGFYRIGIDSERRSRERSETTAALRLVYKLLDDRIRKRDAAIPSLYLKRGGFAALPGLTGEILLAPLEGANPGLERALGFGDLAAHGVARATPASLAARVAGGRFNPAGPFVVELSATAETLFSAGLLDGCDFELRLDGWPVERFAAAGFAPGAGSVAARPAWRADSVEVNAGTLRDLSPAAGETPGAAVSFALAHPPATPPGRLLAAYAAAARALRPAPRVVPEGFPVGVTVHYLNGAALLSDDGLLFHEPGPEGSVAHALYLRRPPPEEAEYDDAGEPLLELRYAFSAPRAGGGRDLFDEPILRDIKMFKFKYYDADADEIVPDAAWAWLPPDRIGTVSFEMRLARGDAARADLTGWRR